jgi:mannose-6-phosphate isomerase
VHPNDEQAVRLEGPDQFGKTEAWHILEADPGARLICGVRPGTPPDVVRNAIRDGTILDWAQYVPVQAGDTVFVGAGTIHALGPGLMLYEVQQTSDITYRVFDWNRPQSAGRALHIDQSLAVSNPQATGQPLPEPPLPDGASAVLVTCPYFTLELVGGETHPVELDTGGESFHALTAIEGETIVETPAGSERLGRYETVIVPAACGLYRLRPLGRFRVLKARV